MRCAQGIGTSPTSCSADVEGVAILNSGRLLRQLFHGDGPDFDSAIADATKKCTDLLSLANDLSSYFVMCISMLRYPDGVLPASTFGRSHGGVARANFLFATL